MKSAECAGLVLQNWHETPTIEKLTVAPPGLGEVRERVRAAGLCHTDLSAVRDARSTPMMLGHEGAGVVESVGPNVDGLEPGQPVLLCWKTPCGLCRRCNGGELPLCERVLDVSEPRVFWRGEPTTRILNTGCFSELVAVPARSVLPFEDDIPFEQIALVGCAVSTGVGAVLRTARWTLAFCRQQ